MSFWTALLTDRVTLYAATPNANPTLAPAYGAALVTNEPASIQPRRATLAEVAAGRTESEGVMIFLAQSAYSGAAPAKLWRVVDQNAKQYLVVHARRWDIHAVFHHWELDCEEERIL